MTLRASSIPALRRAPGRWRSEYTVFAVIAGLLVVAPFFAYPVFLMKCLCMALFACAFNLLIGYVGLLSFGHAMFMGCAGYGSAHAAKVWGLPPEVSILFGTAVAAALGLVVGWLAIRRQGVYFAMITLGLAQMIYFFCLEATFTHGEDGIQSVPRGMLSAALAGLAGATKVLVFQLASLTDVHWTMSGEVILMTLIGGLGRFSGPVVGAFVVVALENYLAGFGSWVTVVQGVVFVLCVLTFRQGIIGKLSAALNRPL